MTKKTMLFILCSLLILSGAMLLYSLTVGEPVDGSQLIYDIYETEDKVVITCTAADPDVRLSTAHMKTDGDALHLRFRKTEKPFWAAQEPTETYYIQKALHSQIWVGGKLVWERTK